MPRIFCAGHKICAYLGKRCRVRVPDLWHDAAMEKEMVSRFEAMRPALKTRWAALLRGVAPAPGSKTGVVTPEMLVLMIDHTLVRLAGEIAAAPVVIVRSRILAPVGSGSGPGACQCGIDLLVGYYLAGEKAVREVLTADFGPGRVRIVHLLNRIAHEEIEALCGVCREWSGSQCHFDGGSDPAKPGRRFCAAAAGRVGARA